MPWFRSPWRQARRGRFFFCSRHRPERSRVDLRKRANNFYVRVNSLLLLMLCCPMSTIVGQTSEPPNMSLVPHMHLHFFERGLWWSGQRRRGGGVLSHWPTLWFMGFALSNHTRDFSTLHLSPKKSTSITVCRISRPCHLRDSCHRCAVGCMWWPPVVPRGWVSLG